MVGSTVFYKREFKSPSAKLNLVALMDIFTILVFFLLLNSGDSQNIEEAEFVRLPDSYSGKAPHADLTVVVGEDILYIGDQPITEIAPILEKPDELIKPLQEALTEHKDKITEMTAFEKKNGLSLTIMGHRDVPYSLVRTVMSTCRQQGFRNISLAVNRIAGDVQKASLGAQPGLAASGFGGL